jgi:hypothetical protein
VTIQDELKATDFREALAQTLRRVQSEETVASVECMESGEVRHFEIQTGEQLDEVTDEVEDSLG